LNYLVNYLGFQAGTLPFNYLGVPIFKGKPKKFHLQPIADKIKVKLSTWKASLLSMAGRSLLVKSVIHAMMVHSLTVYFWPIALLKDIEKWCRNFIWSGDIERRKMVTVSWYKVCKPLNEGGLGMRSLTTLNEASNLKLGWDLINSTEPWAVSLKSRALRNDKPVTYHIYSSIWSSVKNEYPLITDNTCWLLGNGENIKFWSDSWCGNPIRDKLNLPPNITPHLSSKVKDFISNFEWFVPPEVQLKFPQLLNLLNQICIPKVHLEDRLV